MTRAIKHITANRTTWTVGQTVTIPSMDYTGRIDLLLPATPTLDVRVVVRKTGDQYGRTVTIDKVRAA
jgi:hypothetical protein